MTKTAKIAGTVLGGALALGSYVGSVTPASADGDASMPRSAAPVQTFKNEASGGCMQDPDLTLDGSMWTTECEGYTETKWRVIRSGKYVKLKNLATGRCVFDSSHSAGLRVEDQCSDFSGSSALFRVKRWNDGTIRFQSKESGQCIDIADGSVYADMGTRKCDKSESQSWY